ncbi:MAG: FmdB family zinc ribbon protein [Nitrospirota bacterium]
MPIYEYECLKCGKSHEIIQKFSDSPLAACPECGGEVKKLISNTSFVLKGSGWYVTDYARKSEGDAKGKEAADKKAAPDKPDGAAGAKAEAKAEPKADTKKEPASST